MQDQLSNLSIGDIAQRAGVNTSTVRYYESVGLLPAPKRVNGRRRYDSDVVQMLGIIQFAQQAGFTLTEIKTLFDGFERDVPAGARWRTLATHKLVEIEELIQRANHMKQLLEVAMQCGCLRLEDCRIMDHMSDC